MADFDPGSYQPPNPPGQSLHFEFLDLSDTSLSTADKVNLSSIVQPSTTPLPGSGGVWKTPRNDSPDFEFGDGVSAVFKSLSVASPSQSCPSIPITTRPSLSAASSPFVPSIPIPLPAAMSNGQGSAHIHINNFTANLNYHSMQGVLGGPGNNVESHESPVNSYNGMNGHPPMPFAHPSHGSYPNQYVAPFPNGTASLPHVQPTPNLYNESMQGPYQPSGVAVYIPVHPQGYHAPQIVQQRPREEFNSVGITFGSTPVVSIRSGKRVSETEESVSDEKPHQSLPPRTSDALPRACNRTMASQPPPQSVSPQVKKNPVEMPPVPIMPEVVENKIPNGDTGARQTSHNATPPRQSETLKHIKSPPNISAAQKLSPKLPAPKVSDPSKLVTERPIEVTCTNIETKIDTAAVDLSVEDSTNTTPSVSSWASLFASKDSNSNFEIPVKPTARILPFSSADNNDVKPVADSNSKDKELGEFLNSYVLKHLATALLPRGLTNRSNWCFVNAILQALLACPPFYNLFKALPHSTLDLKSQKSKTPMLDSIVEFINEFSVLEQMNKSQKKDRNRKKEDIVTGIGLEPSYVYKMLLNLEEDTFKVVDGRQEDAEEFLSCLLNGLSDEMLSMMKLAAEVSADDAAPESMLENATDDDWQEVGAKGKSCVTRRVNSAGQLQTPIQSLALGMCRSCVKSESGDNSATLQPFFTLQLDIQDQTISSVTDALSQNFAHEKLDGFVCSKTKKEIEATRILSLEELPPILILHLKRFVYDGQTGGVQKVMKQIEFGVDLEISKSILSAECKASTKQRQYKLFGVVYHNGREATKGHYVTDIYHTGYATWLHCDDSIVQPTAEQMVVTPNASSTPYLLFYRRGDTMVGMEKK